MESAKAATSTEMQPVKTLHSFHIEASRYVKVDEENDVSITDEKTGKCAFFTAQRWIRFIQEFPQIDRAVQRAMSFKPTVLQMHIGGHWFVSVTDEVPTVDIRRWFIRVDSVLRPTAAGIALSYSQWFALKKVAEQMMIDLPQFTGIIPCYHDSEKELECCRECNPKPRRLSM